MEGMDQAIDDLSRAFFGLAHKPRVHLQQERSLGGLFDLLQDYEDVLPQPLHLPPEFHGHDQHRQHDWFSNEGDDLVQHHHRHAEPDVRFPLFRYRIGAVESGDDYDWHSGSALSDDRTEPALATFRRRRRTTESEPLRLFGFNFGLQSDDRDRHRARPESPHYDPHSLTLPTIHHRSRSERSRSRVSKIDHRSHGKRSRSTRKAEDPQDSDNQRQESRPRRRYEPRYDAYHEYLDGLEAQQNPCGEEFSNPYQANRAPERNEQRVGHQGSRPSRVRSKSVRWADQSGNRSFKHDSEYLPDS